MEKTYIVSKRGPRGEATELRCAAHEGCAWKLQSTGMKADDDRIFVAQFNHHMLQASTTRAEAFGHARRKRQ